MAQRPAVQIFKINLASPVELQAGSATGQQSIRALGKKIIFVGAQDATGLTVLDATCSLQIGLEAISDPIPLGVNSKVTAIADYWRLTWAIQPGYTGIFAICWSDDPNDLDIYAPPARQLVTSSAGTALGTQQTTVGVAAAVLVAGSSTRQSVTVRNRGTATVYLGGSTVTALNGFALDPGESFTFQGTTAAIWAIASAAATPVHTIQEA